MNVLRALLVLSLSSLSVFSSCGGGSKSGATGGVKMCAPENSTCTTAQTKAYSDCVTTACDTQYKQCLGANYKSGSYGGVCGTYMKCVNACPCDDTNCLLACGLPESACQTCLGSFSTCSATCTEPACYGGGTGTGGRSGTGTGGASGGGTGGASGGGTGGASGTGTGCTDLLACCNASTNTQIKALCMTQYSTVMAMGDDVCAQALSAIKAAACP